MNMFSTLRFFPFLGALTVGCAASIAVLAQDATPPGSMPSAGQAPGVHMTHTPKTDVMVSMHGMHTMPATVTHTDPKTGIVDVMTDGMALRVHFPPATMVTLKAGDKIGLYMAYTQATAVK
jgi:hypothetical protein